MSPAAGAGSSTKQGALSSLLDAAKLKAYQPPPFGGPSMQYLAQNAGTASYNAANLMGHK